MVEMTEAAHILHRATGESLVVIDEIGRGTSTFDGLALAWAIARTLALDNRSLTLFATHYFELTALPSELEGCANVHFDAVEHKDGIVFLHEVAEGPANRSYGLQVAKLAGVPADAIRQARAYLVRLDRFSTRRDAHGDLFARLVSRKRTPLRRRAGCLPRRSRVLSPREAPTAPTTATSRKTSFFVFTTRMPRRQHMIRRDARAVSRVARARCGAVVRKRVARARPLVGMSGAPSRGPLDDALAPLRPNVSAAHRAKDKINSHSRH